MNELINNAYTWQLGLLIPYHVCKDNRLTPADKLLFAALLELKEDHEGLIKLTEAYAKEVLSCSNGTVLRVLNRLELMGYINMVYKSNIKSKGRRIKVNNNKC